MPNYAIGPVTNNDLMVRQVQYAPVVDEVVIPSGQQAVAVDDLFDARNPNALVGRHIDISDPSSPDLSEIGIVDRQAEWFERTGAAFVRGMDNAKQWWPDEFTSAAQRGRAQDVLNLELPNWWRTNAGILAQAISGRAWETMNAAQIEACVAHYEGLLTREFSATSSLPRAIGIIKRWYDIGRRSTTDTSQLNPRGGTRTVNAYGVAATYTLGYTDTFHVANSILMPRNPDYAWNALVGFRAFPANFDPENPA